MPRTFLLTWNPKRWPWRTLETDIAAVAVGAEPVTASWSTGNTRSITVGDRLFLLKLGEEPKGLMGSGYARSAAREAPHWDEARQAAGESAWRVDLRFDRLLRPDAVLPVELLREGPLNAVHWSPPASGFEVPPDLAPVLEALWHDFAPPPSQEALPEELVPGRPYVEGAVRTAVVNQYERDPKAREACIRHWGTDCVVCGFSFGRRYGVHGEGFIHAHHLTPVSTLAGTGVIDPVRDLRPVCANCHSMLHRGARLLTPEELRALLMMP
jgi:5-methylcytosine-specific restriction protein A